MQLRAGERCGTVPGTGVITAALRSASVREIGHARLGVMMTCDPGRALSLCFHRSEYYQYSVQFQNNQFLKKVLWVTNFVFLIYVLKNGIF
jgi:hypothetical protein